MSKKKLNGWKDDPEPGDMDDPEYRTEMFETFKECGYKPETILDEELRVDYEKWLRKNA